MSTPKILIAGIGNIFLGDDGFGCAVIEELLKHPPAENVTVRDFGIRGMDLTYALLEDFDAAILVDAAPRGEAAGTLFVIAPEIPAADDGAGEGGEGAMIDMHTMDPVKVLRLVKAMGGDVKRLILVGCQPGGAGEIDADEMAMGLSPAVRGAVPAAVEMVREIVEQINCGGEGLCDRSAPHFAYHPRV